MNIGTLFDWMAPAGTALPRRSGPSAFAERLAAEREGTSHRFVQGPGFSLRMGENILCSGNVGGGDVQTYEVEFTEDSTEEDPIVRIQGTASGGAFDFTRHIRDVDPTNASYAELAALNRWLCRTGAYQTKFSTQAGSVLPCRMDCGDISKKRDFLGELRRFLASASDPSHYPKYGPDIYGYARELLGVYEECAGTARKAPCEPEP